MGYSCTISSDREITEPQVQEIVDKLPKMFKGWQFDGNPKQSWGWNLYSDVKLPTGNKLVISGSYSISGGHSGKFIEFFVKELENNGHKITTDMS